MSKTGYTTITIRANIMKAEQQYEKVGMAFCRIAGKRYWVGLRGRIRRNPTMKPLVHKGGKP